MWILFHFLIFSFHILCLKFFSTQHYVLKTLHLNRKDLFMDFHPLLLADDFDIFSVLYARLQFTHRFSNLLKMWGCRASKGKCLLLMEFNILGCNLRDVLNHYPVENILQASDFLTELHPEFWWYLIIIHSSLYSYNVYCATESK